MVRTSTKFATITITTSLATCLPIDMSDCAGGGYCVSAASTSMDLLTFYASYDGTNYFALYSRANVAVTQVTAESRAYPLPDECYGFPFIKAVGDGAGTIYVSRKS